MLARVIEILLDKFKVNVINEDLELLVKARGNVKKKEYIKVGDIVELSKIDNEYLIVSVNKRKNDYIRPPAANIDYVFIVIAAGCPKPDYLLLDKQIITAVCNNSIPIIVINKMDLKNSNKVSSYVSDTYAPLGYKIILTSTIDNKLLNENSFRNIPEESLCAFSGNSGVGKSSIISNIKKDKEILDVNSVSHKTGRGRHTTKKVVIYDILNYQNKPIYFLDTPGFSSFELFNISSSDLKLYFSEFLNCHCEYDDCNHINEQEEYCKVKQAVKLGKIDKLRYEHYAKIYEELLQKEKRMYK